MTRKGYKAVSLPEELIEFIRKVIEERPELGYDSIADFVKDAIRRRLKELGYNV